MKKVCMAIIFLLIGCLCSFVGGCSGGFKTVCMVSYTTSGKTKVEKSREVFRYESTLITKEEYDASPVDKRVTSKRETWTKDLSPSFKIPKDKKGKLSYLVEIEPYEEYYKISSPNGTRYYKNEYKSHYYYFFQVKVINDETIEIKRSSGKTTKFIVTSYSITYFDD